MKKFLVSMMAVITAVLLVACSNASNKDLVHVGVLQYVEHPSLSATRKGFIEELKEEGYVDGKNIKIDYQNAQGDRSNLQTISQEEGDHPGIERCCEQWTPGVYGFLSACICGR